MVGMNKKVGLLDIPKPTETVSNYISANKPQDHLLTINKKSPYERTDASACITKEQCGSMMLACQNGHIDTVKDLIENQKVMVNFMLKQAKVSPLIMASSRGHSDIVELLLKYKAFVNEQAHVDHTFSPVQQDSLTKKEVVVKGKGPTPLHAVCDNAGLPESIVLKIARTLVKNGADVMATAYDPLGEYASPYPSSPIDYCVEHNFKEVRDFLSFAHYKQRKMFINKNDNKNRVIVFYNEDYPSQPFTHRRADWETLKKMCYQSCAKNEKAKKIVNNMAQMGEDYNLLAYHNILHFLPLEIVEHILSFSPNQNNFYVSSALATQLIKFLIWNGGQCIPGVPCGLNTRLRFERHGCYITLDGPLLELYEQEYYKPSSEVTQLYHKAQELSK